MAGSTLAFTSAPSARTYSVNVTASVVNFGPVNHHKILDIMVSGTETNATPVLDDIGSKRVNELEPSRSTPPRLMPIPPTPWSSR